MIVIKSTVSHEKIIEVETEDEAMNIIRMWEDIDRSEGTYIPNGYYIEVVWCQYTGRNAQKFAWYEK